MSQRWQIQLPKLIHIFMQKEHQFEACPFRSVETQQTSISLTKLSKNIILAHQVAVNLTCSIQATLNLHFLIRV